MDQFVFGIECPETSGNFWPSGFDPLNSGPEIDDVEAEKQLRTVEARRLENARACNAAVTIASQSQLHPQLLADALNDFVLKN